MKVNEVMTRNVVTARLDTPVSEIARLLVENDISGVPVVNDQGDVVGLVSESDLIVQDANLHFPTYVTLLDSIIYLSSTSHFETELQKFLATTAAEIMNPKPIVVGPDTDVRDVASHMVDDNANPIPVVQDHRLIGIVSRADLVKLMVRETEQG